MSEARQVAYTVLRRVFEEGAYADRALRGEAEGLDPRERSFAQALAYGAVQRRGTLDHVIAALSDRELDPPVQAALRLGLYELMFHGGVAAHAAVNEAVELAPVRARGLVNAVLRRYLRDGFELPGDADPAAAAVTHSHPEWLVRMWWEMLGADETRALLARDNEPPELALRVNSLAPAELQAQVPGTVGDAGVTGALGGVDLPEARIVEGAFDAFASPLWEAGAFMPQSRASMLVARTLDPQPGERVLDLCAAPGGKTTHLAALMEGEGEVVAVERHPGRAAALERTAKRMHAANLTVLVEDARNVTGAFDRVLVDPPCSGLGTLQRRPDLRWRVSPESIAAVALEQDEILAAARAALAPGGVLVYSVCTLSPSEERLGGEGVDARRTLPHRDRTDGFYIARHGGAAAND